MMTDSFFLFFSLDCSTCVNSRKVRKRLYTHQAKFSYMCNKAKAKNPEAFEGHAEFEVRI